MLSAKNRELTLDSRPARPANPRLPRLAGALGLSAALFVLPGCDLSPQTPHEIGAANRVTDHLPASSSARPSAAASPTPTPEATETTAPAPSTATVTETAPAVTKTAPPKTTASAATVTVTKTPTVTQAPPPQSITVEGVMPNLAGTQPGDCGIGGTPGNPQLEGLVGPFCDEQAPVLVAGKVHPLCRILGGTVVLGDGEEHKAWIVWEETGTHKRYVSPNVYLNVGPMAPCSPANNTFGVPNADG